MEWMLFSAIYTAHSIEAHAGHGDLAVHSNYAAERLMSLAERVSPVGEEEPHRIRSVIAETMRCAEPVCVAIGRAP